MANGRLSSNIESGPAVKFMKILLTVFNVIFTISGIAFLAIGVWMKVDLQKFMLLSDDYYVNTPYILIALGCIIFIVGSLGCCCTFKGVACLLYLYSGFLVIVFIIELSAGICGFIYRAKVEAGFETGLNKALKEYTPEGEATVAIDDLQKLLKCCGVLSFEDWFATPWSRGQNQYVVPKSCCAKEDACERSWNSPPGENVTDIYSQGCYSKATTWMDGHFGEIGGAAIGISFLQLFGAFIATCLAKNLNKAKYEQVT